ncbi:MAG: glycosyltransferase family 39 protein [Isosphaeraceae bacterium]|nr:glycosyltransferase family 39 protein [Isosphaeraceae bacterium]
MAPVPARTIRPRWHLLAIFAVSVTLRLLAVAYYPEVPTNDPADYHRLAESVVAGHGYAYKPGKPTAFRVCGYPLFLAATYGVTGPDWLAAERVQAILGGCTVLLVVALAWLVVGEREAILAGYIASVYPALVWLPHVLLSENLSVFLQLAALCGAALLLRQPRANRALALGALLGLNLLTRGGSLFMAALLLVGVASTAGERPFGRRGLRLAALAVLSMLLTLTPWIVRNYSAFHHFVPIATEDGITLYISYWPVRVGDKPIWGNVPGTEDPVVAEAYRAETEVGMSRHLRGVALGRLRKDPAHALKLVPIKLLNLLVPLDWEIIPHRARAGRSVNYGYIALCVPALFGAWVLQRRQVPHQWVLWVPPASVLLLACAFYGSPRFRLPAEPALIIFAASGLLLWWDHASRLSRAAVPVGFSSTGRQARRIAEVVPPEG